MGEEFLISWQPGSKRERVKARFPYPFQGHNSNDLKPFTILYLLMLSPLPNTTKLGNNLQYTGFWGTFMIQTITMVSFSYH
jgi:hypothetical protein